ncbi:hypothetical protein B0H14DRAFT_3475972 [Mycena olivaceomarginata]|nr:hypothetical protein B0H14DRAFT_3475972 [Mycena olivaceomarginata]
MARVLVNVSCSLKPFFVIDISQLGFELHPDLEHLTIRGGSIYSPKTPPLAKIWVEHFSFYASRFYLPKADDSRRSFLYALDPNSLCLLALHTFYNLRTLSITYPFLMHIRDHGLIPRFHRLQRFIITGKSGGQYDAAATTAVPSARAFHGSLRVPTPSCSRGTHFKDYPPSSKQQSAGIQRIRRCLYRTDSIHHTSSRAVPNLRGLRLDGDCRS